jgi:ferric-dicitrate binding protein FerR (iron transport regulator)
MDDKIPTTGTDELLIRCLEGIADDAEYEHAWQWVHQSPENRTYYGKLRDAWIAAGLLKPVYAIRQRQVWLRLEQKLQPEKVLGKSVRMKILKWAAAAAIVVFAYILGTQTSATHENMEIAKGEYTIEAPKGGKSVMTLIDGSKVWLNAGSVLHFDKSFGEQNRNLALQGEAYFEVARDAGRPFMVETSGITIAALGTAFNVKAYPEDDQIETTLVSGSVRIETNAQSKTKAGPVVLEPNQKVVFCKNRQSISVHTNVDVEVSVSWKDKRWIVQGEQLGVFANIIERKYDVEVIFEDRELEQYRISATLEEETIEQLFNAIRLTAPLDYRIERNRVYLKINRNLKMRYDRLIQNK